jgi:hypothetical protein
MAALLITFFSNEDSSVRNRTLAHSGGYVSNATSNHLDQNKVLVSLFQTHIDLAHL